MAITSAELEYVYSGGAGNTDKEASLGGVISTLGVIPTNVSNNDMNDITSSEATAGVIIYRGYYFRNTNVSLIWLLPVFWIDSETTSTTTQIALAVALEAAGVAMNTIPDENTAPSPAVAFSRPTNKGAGIALGDIGPASFRGIWVEYTVTALTQTELDAYTIKGEGDTLP